jgi:hypothetical protein
MHTVIIHHEIHESGNYDCISYSLNLILTVIKMFSMSQILQRKGAIFPKNLGTRRVILSKFHTEHRQVLVVTVQNLVARAISK